jgi:hypothetical protein
MFMRCAAGGQEVKSVTGADRKAVTRKERLWMRCGAAWAQMSCSSGIDIQCTRGWGCDTAQPP